MTKNVSYWAVTFKVINSWWWVMISLVAMFLFSAIAVALMLRVKVPPQIILEGFFYTLLLSIFLFFFAEFLINLFMGAQRVDHKKYPNFVRAMQEIKQERRMWFLPRMRILPMTVPNAMAYGSGILGQCCIGITPRLYHMLTADELKAVVAHEYGHIRSLDVGLMTVVSMISGSLERLRLIAFGHANLGISVLLYIPGIFLFLISKVAFGVLRMAISKEREFAADALAAWYIGSPDPLISALQKLGHYSDKRKAAAKATVRKKAEKAVESDTPTNTEKDPTILDDLFPQKPTYEPIFKDLLFSHPDTAKRIRSLESLRIINPANQNPRSLT
jgi:heat shock protein HtpX